ncbi:YesL family protein [Neobacillus sp. 179-C4.2 HS]|uniref:YesL family protein n=1 Tax=Neobacillus driksii TaxID=3035913 RepID=A0ABV4YUR9_9BACI|nr:YesL family protein [Neobacillus sp. 179.-C4.2 HS]MDP5192651.1 YesL family protein [Neobacillus sp. 179.-C4.2 HS]
MTAIFDGRFLRLASKVSNLFLLNILWIIFSIPIITMGAATSAVYYVTLKMVKNEEGYIIKDFWYAFRQNLKQGIIIELVLLVGGVILLGDIWYFLHLGNIFGYIFAGTFSIGLTVYVLTLIFTFPLLAKYNNTVSGTLKNAVLLSLKHLPSSIAMAVLLIIMLYGFYVSVHLMIIFSVIGASGFAYFGSFIFRGIFEN